MCTAARQVHPYQVPLYRHESPDVGEDKAALPRKSNSIQVEAPVPCAQDADAADNRARYLCPDEGHRAGRSSCSESNGQSPNITEQVRCEYSNPQSRIAGSRMPDSGKLADPPSAMFGNGYSMSGSFAIPMSFGFLLLPLADIFPKQRHRANSVRNGLRPV